MSNIINTPKTIEQGAALLDQHFGGRHWVHQIKPNKINMDSAVYCILGQLFGSFEVGKNKLNIIGAYGMSPESHNVFSGTMCNSLRFPHHAWYDFIKEHQERPNQVDKETTKSVTRYLLTFTDGSSMLVESLKDAPKGVLFTYKEI